MNLEFQAERLFDFPHFQNWVNTASRKFKSFKHVTTVCVDTGGNIIDNGGGMEHARDNNLFPVTVFRLDKMIGFELKYTTDNPNVFYKKDK